MNATRSLPRFMAAAALASSLLTGCASIPRDTRSGSEFPDGSIIHVDNRTIDQLVIYAARDGMRVRIATIPGFSSRTLRLPPALTGSGIGFQLLARPLGSSTVIATEPFSLVPGTGFEWTVGSSAAATYLVRR